MKTIDAVKFFRTQQGLAEALGSISQSGISQWGEYPPLLRQYQIESVTGGVLKADKAGSPIKLPKKPRNRNLRHKKVKRK